MESLRLEADKSSSEAEELKQKVKSLEQNNLGKEQEIKSLAHKNSVLETEVEKLEGDLKSAKNDTESLGGHRAENESMSRRLQLLEEEADAADKTIRETNEKYCYSSSINRIYAKHRVDYGKPMSRQVTMSERSRRLRLLVINGRKSTKKWRRNMLK